MPKVIQVCLSKAGFIHHVVKSRFSKKTIRRRRALRYLGIFATIGFFTLVFLTIFPIYHKPNFADAAPSIPSTTEITISSGRNTATVNLVPVNDAGVFASTTPDSQIEFSVYTNNLTGYALTINADDDSGLLIDPVTGHTLDSISSNMDKVTFDNPSNNGKWGYQPSMLNSVANTDFIPSPTSTYTILNQTRCANGQTTIYGGVTYICPDEDKYTIGLGTRANLDQPAGSYSNTFTLYAIGNLMPYILMYADDTGDASVDNLPPNYEGVVDPDTTTTVDVMISETRPTRTGYDFKYWCEGTVSSGGTVCVGDIYEPSTATVPSYYIFNIDESGISNTKILYAVWTPNNYQITLDNTTATTLGSTMARVTFGRSDIYSGSSGTDPIVNPSEHRVVSGFSTDYNDASGAVVTYSSYSICQSATNCSITYDFDGWYTAISGGSRVINVGGALVASSPYTDSSSRWKSPSDQTLYARFLPPGEGLELPFIDKTGYECGWTTSTNTDIIEYESGATITPHNNLTLYGVCNIKSFRLTVKPNGGTWSGSTSDQIFSQKYKTTKSIPDPTANPVFSITYNANGQGASYTPGPTSLERAFTGWANDGPGTLSGTTYTFGAGDGVLTANYETTKPLTLPTITKLGHTCKWARGSASGAQYDGGANLNITRNEDFFAVCTPNPYDLTVNPNGGKWGGSTDLQTFTQLYNTTKSIANPSANATYTITYNPNGQGASYTGTPTKAERAFNGWTLSGYGNWNASTKIYTYGAGNGTLTATYKNTSNSFTLPNISKTGYTCKWAEGSASGTQYAGGTSRTITGNTTYFAKCTINSYKLTVKPNGGTWSGSTSNQSFTQNYNTTKSIPDPTSTPSYTISYNGNGQGASYSSTPTSVSRSFTGWTKGGQGTWNASTKIYTYGAGDGELTANYNSASNSFNLPGISKTGHTCKWAEGSASGTQYAGGASRTIKGNTTYYAVCSPKSFTITIKTATGISSVSLNGTSCSSTSGCQVSLTYNQSYTLTATVSSGYKFDSWSLSGSGTINSTTSASTTYKVGNGTATITPSASTVDMQNYDVSTCPTNKNDSIPDSRDGEVYTVRKINSKCWMTKNLEIGCNGNKVLTPSDSNVSSNWNTANAGPWNNSVEADQDAHKLCGPAGAWYNYIAASAGSSATSDASQDICPKNWRLPTKDEIDGLTSFSAKTAFNPTNGGGDIEEFGASKHKDTSYYWSGKQSTGYNHYFLYYQNENNEGAVAGDGKPYYGFFIRCVHK